MALASLEPAPGPATTKSVFLLTEPAGFPPAARTASSASSRLKPSMVPVTTTVLPAKGPVAPPSAASRITGRSGTTPASTSSRRTSRVVSSANQALIAAATVGPMPLTSWIASDSSVATRRSSASTAANHGSGTRSGAAGGKASGRMRVASQRARSTAVDSPTCEMPRALITLASGRVVLAFWMAAARFSALLRPKRSSVSSCSAVSAKKSARRWIMPRSRSWVRTAQPAPSMSMPPRPAKCEYAWLRRAGHTGFGQ